MKELLLYCKNNVKGISILGGPLLGLVSAIVSNGIGLQNIQSRMIGITVFMITWWISLCVPIGVTALFPLFLLPLFGIASADTISSSYFEDSIVVCFGSLLISDAIEYYSIHRKFANIFLSRAMAGGLNGILVSFLLCTAFISMFLSNSATAALMTPLARVIVGELKNSRPRSEQEGLLKAAKAIDIGIAYASTIGGQATITGTGANLVLQGLMLETFGPSGSISYLQWMMLSLPLSIVNLLLLWLVLYLYFMKTANISSNDTYQKVEIEMTNNSPIVLGKNINEDVDEVECKFETKLDDDEFNIENKIITKKKKITFSEFVVITTFMLMVLLWITRDPPGGGWSNLFYAPTMISDGTVAIFCASILLITPAAAPFKSLYYFFDKEDDTNWSNVLDFSSVGKHWEVLLLLGAGFAISKGFQNSGLEVSIALMITNNNATSIISLASIGACMLTNIMSNVAAANLILPPFICIGPSNSTPINPIIILYPLTLSVSLALLFPFGTPPNAIIMANKNVEMKDLFVVGSICSLIFLSTTLLASNLILPNLVSNNISQSIIDACIN